MDKLGRTLIAALLPREREPFTVRHAALVVVLSRRPPALEPLEKIHRTHDCIRQHMDSTRERSPQDDERAETPIGTVAVVGFPNVGKSTLVNRLSESRAAVVHETPGVTRDRKEVMADWNGKRFRLIDTGGVDIVDQTPITRSIVEQAHAAIAEADLILFVVDARAGITPGDEELAAILRRAHKPVLLLANKIDDPDQDALAFEFHRLGLGDPVPLSAQHGHGTGDLLDAVVTMLPGSGPQEVGEDAIRVAILGRPNVGKSSLLNALLGEERVIVSEVPGTTRDAIDTVLQRGDRTFVLVDTAGIRRKRKQRQGIEYYSELRALAAAERADVALVLIDASEGLVDQDLTVADIARKAQDSTLVVLSKWDITETELEDIRPRLESRLRQRPPLVTLSAKTGRGISRLLDRVEQLYEKHVARVGTGELNRFLAELREAREPPSRKGKRLNLLYGTQVQARPPRFRFFVNDPGLITRDYGYWVENQLRDRFALQGVPVSIDFVRRS
jgi:GTPase